MTIFSMGFLPFTTLMSSVLESLLLPSPKSEFLDFAKVRGEELGTCPADFEEGPKASSTFNQSSFQAAILELSVSWRIRWVIFLIFSANELNV